MGIVSDSFLDALTRLETNLWWDEDFETQAEVNQIQDEFLLVTDLRSALERIREVAEHLENTDGGSYPHIARQEKISAEVRQILAEEETCLQGEGLLKGKRCALPLTNPRASHRAKITPLRGKKLPISMTTRQLAQGVVPRMAPIRLHSGRKREFDELAEERVRSEEEQISDAASMERSIRGNLGLKSKRRRTVGELDKPESSLQSPMIPSLPQAYNLSSEIEELQQRMADLSTS